jgi:hypothetical protein
MCATPKVPIKPSNHHNYILSNIGTGAIPIVNELQVFYTARYRWSVTLVKARDYIRIT